MEDHEERVMGWGDDIIVAYARIAKVLLLLPLPIELPLNAETPGFVRDAQAAIVRSLALIQDQPLDEVLYVALRQVLLDWLIAMDLSAIELSVPMSWREGAFGYTIARIHAGVDFTQELIFMERDSDE